WRYGRCAGAAIATGILRVCEFCRRTDRPSAGSARAPPLDGSDPDRVFLRSRRYVGGSPLVAVVLCVRGVVPRPVSRAMAVRHAERTAWWLHGRDDRTARCPADLLGRGRGAARAPAGWAQSAAPDRREDDGMAQFSRSGTRSLLFGG